ncbi:MAG: LCP family protein [Actinomycetota bacterium]|nr:LCP family protein [Actinomycetota bacterium]
MADKEKPYKVYRGGRVKGPVRAPVARERADGGKGSGGGGGYRGTYAEPVRKRRRWRRGIALFVLLLLLLTVVWGVLGFLAFRNGVKEANGRLDGEAARALSPSEGSILSIPSTILLIGSDAGPGKGRSRKGLSDSLMLVRSDPNEHRMSLLSIPRDLRVPIADHGEDKINAAYPLGGAALTLKTVQNLTGLPINHVVIVDFQRFGEVIDALGGVTINVKKPILSKFDCPYGTPARCQRWKGWRFSRGVQEMDGHRALLYSRVRKNLLDPQSSDLTRIANQQQVVQAIGSKATSFGTFLRLPLIGDDLARPLTTDLSAGELMQLAWVKRRAAADPVRCRLGGSLSSDGSYILAEDTGEVILMFTGKAAAQPPRPGSELLGPGCFVGQSAK